MKRRSFLSIGAATGATLWLPRSFGAQAMAAGMSQSRGYDNLLILIELKGGNDGLNTVIPFADPTYYALRRNVGIKREQAIQLDDHTALHPSLRPLLALWRSRQLAIVQGVGYAQPNVSHFRSTEIWDTASRSDQYLREGWLTRAFAQTPVPAGFAADGVVIGSAEMGPLAHGARALSVANPAQFVDVTWPTTPVSPPTRLHNNVANSIPKAAYRARLAQGHAQLKTVFPDGAFGSSIRAAMQMLATRDAPNAPSFASTARGLTKSSRGVAVICLTLSGFDTHQNQPAQQTALLRQLGEGVSAMKSALVELGRWDSTLVMTYAEFGRRPRENESRGTEHGTVAPHFVMGGRVRGGLYGMPPTLARLDGNGNLPLGVDFRRLYATVLGPWWGLDASAILQQRFEPLPLLND
ncbi:DUF1501 domain-containing protein [Paraburkholderia fynbosensis]|uniref:Twin-arginine translocation pathway signal sequence domain-containing protein n=1 Tax=Paraburkholderia fynbosensis TaxID=1200993 RepID=A0A6J5FBB8_9BURK|nr:DUF1501 domain-containing protein [Paraburkholderia fynbosensis]CAB3776620.1 hypothetical protein LMG27177_00178 [Paraburkholderia fynbosensis]